MGISLNEQLEIFRILSAILLLGNIAIEGTAQAYIKENAALEQTCTLLGILPADFKRALASPRISVGSGPTKEVVSQARTPAQVMDEAGSLAKALFEKQFGSLVARINQSLYRSESDSSAFIGVLDIAGFEIFDINSFEQLCINLTNERLQQFFNHHMFVLEQDLYTREGIDWEHVDFGLNLQPTIDLIASSSPIGILTALDDASVMPKATDSTFTTSLHDRFTKEESFKSVYERNRFGNGFTIKHYAGQVHYDTSGWLEKNKDPLNTDLTTVLSHSKNPIVLSFFSEYISNDSTSAGRTTGRVKKGVFRTTSQRHREQLDSLMSQLRSTEPHFVRCIVPNSIKRPRTFETPLVLEQLRCNGVIEGIRIARLGYPNRLAFFEFRSRYELLTPKLLPQVRLLQLIDHRDLTGFTCRVSSTDGRLASVCLFNSIWIVNCIVLA